MQTFAGRILARRDAPEGWLTVDRGRVVASGLGEPPEASVATGWICPSPVNAHTHIGDTWLRDKPGKPRSVAELVGPNGWKHHHLARPDHDAMDAGAARLADEAAAVGTAVMLDFREGGLAGVQWLRRQELAVEARVFGRCEGPFDEDEARQVARAADGIGISGLRDVPASVLDAWADVAKAARKPIAMHVSEDKRDDIDNALSVDPAFVIHMTHGRSTDFEELAQADIPIVACPRSNAWFGMRPPLRAMLDAGCKVALGTDNGMLHDGDVLAEARAARSLLPQADEETLLRMATYHGRDLCGLGDPWPARRGAAADVVVLPFGCLTPQGTKPQLGVGSP